jgi:hydrogenase-4 membrane subunit HyfE
MKHILRIILIIVLVMLVTGFYLKSSGDYTGEIIVGISVLIIAFILMPLFIFHRYKNKELKSFELKNWLEKVKEHEEKNK